MNTTKKTLEPDDETGAATPRPKQPLKPRITLLYHPDLSRIGAMTAPEVLPNGQWVTIGRESPHFTAPTPDIVGGPLNDPYISREQFKVRWLEEQGTFEVKLSGGRRPISVIDLAPGQPEPQFLELQNTRQLDSRTLVSIGKRVLLLLTLSPWREPSEDRLGMLGETNKAWQLRDEIRETAKFSKPVLVLGSTGTGKELVARALHTLSDRADGPFLPINCAALPEHLAESLLFGHTKGAFTGADTNRSGAFVEAKGGTLFMDEIGDLSLPIQAKLLRVLQEGQVKPLGTNHPVPIDVRLIAATNRSLKIQMAAGEVRSDFYYRIAVHQLGLTPLLERCWDVPLLFIHFLRMNRKNYPDLGWLWENASAARVAIPMSFFLMLLRQPWTGNIRQLQNTVDLVSAHNLSGAPFKEPTFPKLTPTQKPKTNPSAPQNKKQAATHPKGQISLPKLLKHLGISRKILVRLLPDGLSSHDPDTESFVQYAGRIEEQLLTNLLHLFDTQAFNQVHIARHMDISRTTLVRLMKRFGIPRASDLSTEVCAALRTNTRDVQDVARELDISSKALELYMRYSTR